MDLYDVLRVVNVITSAICCHLLIASTIKRWDILPHRMHRISIGFIGLLLTVCYSSVESLVNDVPPGLRTPVTTVVLIGIVIALTVGFNDDYDKPPGGSE